MSMALVTTIELLSITCEQSSHDGGNRNRTSSKKKMGVISYQRPGKTGSASVYKNLAQPVNKVPIANLVFKYGLALNPPDNDVVQCSGRVYSGFSRHGGRPTFLDPFVNFSQASPQSLKLTAGYRTINIEYRTKTKIS
jgi:hypothetical protein